MTQAAENLKISKRNVLVVDDDPTVIQKLEDLFKPHNISVTGCKSASEAFFALQSSQSFPVVILDFVLPDMSGDELIRKVKSLSPGSFICTLSGAPSEIENAVNCIKNGADNFFQKAGSLEYFEETILNAFKDYEGSRAESVNEQLEVEIKKSDLITISKKMKIIIAKAMQSANNKLSVLITGETGTGKELIAKFISEKFGGSFYPVNCSNFTNDTNLLESELFGHEKGSFTGAVATKIGIFEEASGGIVYLDEVDRMSLSSQAKLLRAIQEKKIKRLGGTKEIGVDIKIIASSKPIIKTGRDSGEFLADLYGRLNVIRLDLPSLKERTEDIEALISHFSKKHIKTVGSEKTFELASIDLLKSYHWPENIRELENFYLRLAVHTAGDVIRTKDMIEHIDVFKELNLQSFDKISSSVDGENDPDSYKTKTENFERFILSSALKKYDNSISETARQLKINKATLHNKLKNLNLLPATKKTEEK